jgi:hypothetical protein
MRLSDKLRSAIEKYIESQRENTDSPSACACWVRFRDEQAKRNMQQLDRKRGNISRTYPSQKMAFSIYCESAVELRLIYTLEHNPDVLATLAHPPKNGPRNDHCSD